MTEKRLYLRTLLRTPPSAGPCPAPKLTLAAPIRADAQNRTHKSSNKP